MERPAILRSKLHAVVAVSGIFQRFVNLKLKHLRWRHLPNGAGAIVGRNQT
jgi:hypothetical protein